MALLHVSAIAEDTIAAPGNLNPSYIVVSVTDANGAPVTGLALANFKLGTQIVGPGGSTSAISTVSAAGLPGCYHLLIKSAIAQPWKPGVYIWSVAVTRGADHGQALCSALMD